MMKLSAAIFILLAPSTTPTRARRPLSTMRFSSRYTKMVETKQGNANARNIVGKELAVIGAVKDHFVNEVVTSTNTTDARHLQVSCEDSVKIWGATNAILGVLAAFAAVPTFGASAAVLTVVTGVSSAVKEVYECPPGSEFVTEKDVYNIANKVVDQNKLQSIRASINAAQESLNQASVVRREDDRQGPYFVAFSQLAEAELNCVDLGYIALRTQLIVAAMKLATHKLWLGTVKVARETSPEADMRDQVQLTMQRLVEQIPKLETVLETYRAYTDYKLWIVYGMVNDGVEDHEACRIGPIFPGFEQPIRDDCLAKAKNWRENRRNQVRRETLGPNYHYVIAKMFQTIDFVNLEGDAYPNHDFTNATPIQMYNGCLQYAMNSKVIVAPCSGRSDQLWTFDFNRNIAQIRSGSDKTKCLDGGGTEIYLANVCDNNNPNMKFEWDIASKQLKQFVNGEWHCFELPGSEFTGWRNWLARTTECTTDSGNDQFIRQRIYYPFGYSITTTAGCKCLDYSGSSIYMNPNCHLDTNQQWFYDSYWGQISNLADGKCLYFDGELKFKPCYYYALDQYSQWTWDENTKEIRPRIFQTICLHATNDGIRLNNLECTQFQFNKLWIRGDPDEATNSMCITNDVLEIDFLDKESVDSTTAGSSTNNSTNSGNNNNNATNNNNTANNNDTVREWPPLDDTSGWSNGTQQGWRLIPPGTTTQYPPPNILHPTTAARRHKEEEIGPHGSTDGTAPVPSDTSGLFGSGDDADCNSGRAKGSGKGSSGSSGCGKSGKGGSSKESIESGFVSAAQSTAVFLGALCIATALGML